MFSHSEVKSYNFLKHYEMQIIEEEEYEEDDELSSLKTPKNNASGKTSTIV